MSNAVESAPPVLRDAPASSETGLARGLTSAQVAMIGLSGALGTGLFLGSGAMIAEAGPGVIVSYALTGILSLVVVWCLAEMTVVHPVAGGFGAAAHAYLGPLGGWLVRWNVAVVMCIAVGAEVVATGNYLAWWFPGLDVGIGTVLASLLIVVINLATVKAYGTSEYWFSIIKVTMVVVFIALGTVMVLFGLPGRPAIGLGHLTGDGGFAPFGLKGILVGAVMAIFSFGGVENVSVASAESENPQRDVPRAARAMIIRLVLFYVLAIAVVVALQPWRASAASKGGVLESPFVKVLALVNVPHAADIMNFVLVTAALSSANGCLYASARMLHSLSLDRLAPRFIGRTSSSGAPRNAVALATVGMVAASVLALVSPDKAFETLYGVLVFGLLTTWVLITATYVAFRLRRARLGLPQSPARLWGGPVTASLALVCFLAVYVALGSIDSLSIALPAGLPYLVLLLWGYAVVRRRVTSFAPSVLEEELAAREG
ncbi:amino acid permease [Luteococcus peritonei]|uniref:Amino acid permease n=1 Tax=Luteococcus peritonei TaxID=88874 RepID=A0ABW4RSW0_9ACTN